MSHFKSEVIQRLRSDIRSKLDQIGAFVDNELADYIMVLVANQKTKYQMKDDLSLFLGAETDQFVNWLHTTLKQLQLNANPSDDKKVVANEEEVQTKEMTKKTSLDANKSNAKHKRTKSDGIQEDKPEVATKSVSESDVKGNSEPEKGLIPQTNDVVESDDNKLEKHEQNDSEVVLRLNPDGDGDVDELLQESDVNDNHKIGAKKVETKQEVAKEVKSIKATLPRRQPLTTAPVSTIGAVVRSKPRPVSSDDEDSAKECNSRPVVSSVASVVRVTQRKPSVPLALQANKNLLLRAMKDAHQSTARKRTIDEVAEYTPTPITPIKKRLGEKSEIVFTDEVQPDLDPQDLRNYLNVVKTDSDKTDDESEELPKTNRFVKSKIIERNPQFVVTLDGVDHNKYSQESEMDDPTLLDEDMETEFDESADMGDNDLENDVLSANKVNERCRFWPSCKNGDSCPFSHPCQPCKTFPNCRFGDKCLYIHPDCKFDAMCSRRDCPFTHASKRKIPAPAYASNTLPMGSVKQCKFQSNCKNMNCPYIHPKVCRFGAKCHSRDCPFSHPVTDIPYIHPQSITALPQPHQLKWKASERHISDRHFATSDEPNS